MKLQLAAWALCVPFLAFSQITVDGNMNDALFYEIAKFTSGQNGFGSSNDLGKTMLYTTTSEIYLGITCNMDGYNRVVVVMDFTDYNGRGPVADLGSGIGGFTDGASSSCLDQTQLQIDADFMFAINEDNTSTNLYIHGIRFGTDEVFSDGYLGTCNQSGTPATISNYTGFAGDGEVIFAYQNNFNRTTADSTKGVEMSIHIDALPGISSTSELQSVFVFITDGSGGGSNETMPGDPGSTSYECDRDYLGEQYLSLNNTTLPVAITSFESEVLQNNIHLNWTTASEINNSHFEIERSSDGNSWTTIGQVNGAGTTTTAHYYSFTDNNPALGYNYYRLRQVDFDGGYEYSEIVSGELRGSGSISMAPNPVKDVLYLSPGTEIRIFDQLGRMVFSTMVSGNSIDISNLPSGLYIADLRNGSEQRTEQLIKQ